MSTRNDGLVARVAELDTLGQTLAASQSSTQVMVVEGAVGSGRRSLVSTAFDGMEAGERPILKVRAQFADGEDALRMLLRLFAGLYTTLARDAELKAQVEAVITAKLAEPDLAEKDPMRLWLQALQEGMEKEIPDSEAPTFQVTIPRASPYLGLLRILDLMGDHFHIVVEIGNAQAALSFAFWTFLAAVIGASHKAERPAAFILWHAPGPEGDELEPLRKSSQINGALSALDDAVNLTRLSLGTFSAEQLGELTTAAYPGAQPSTAFLSALADLSGGMPGAALDVLARLAEQDKLQERGGTWTLSATEADLSYEALSPELPEGDQALMRRALQIGALEGPIMTSSVVAEALEKTKDEIDDLLDEMEDHLEEVVFHEGLQTWLYKFKSPLLRRAVSEGLSKGARQEQARQVATLLERRYVTRARDYAVKASRLWQEAGEVQRALRLVGLATSMERPEVLQMGFEILHTEGDAPIAKPIARGLMLSLLEKLGAGGNPAIGMQVVDRLETWAQENDAADLLPWAAQYRARFLLRLGKADEAAELAETARKAFAKAGNAIKQGETLALLAQIELRRGQPAKALETSKRALKMTDFPPVQAQAHFTKGMVHKMKGELQPAVDDLKATLDLAARTGMFPLHADAGLNLSETLLMGNNPSGAMNLLNQLLNFTRQNKMQQRERGVLSLLGKANAALQDYTQAGNFASDALKLARAMKNKVAEAADLFDLGLYSYLKKSFDEADIYLKEAEHAAGEIKHVPLLTEIHFHRGLVAAAQDDHDGALAAYVAAEPLCRQIGNQRRLTNILFNLGALYLHKNELDKARRYLDEAQPLVEKFGSDADKKGIRRALTQLDDKLH